MSFQVRLDNIQHIAFACCKNAITGAQSLVKYRKYPQQQNCFVVI